MGRRTLIDWKATGSNGEYYKNLSGLDLSRIRTITENGADLILGEGIDSLNNGEYFQDWDNDIIYIKMSDASNPNNKTIILYTYYQLLGLWGTQAEMDANEIFTYFKPGVDFYVKYFKIWIIKRGAPLFSNMKLHIYNNNNILLASPVNASWTDSYTDFDNAISEIWFKYDHFPTKTDETYKLVLKMTGAFDADNQVAWLKRESVYSTDATILMDDPLRYVAIGRKI